MYYARIFQPHIPEDIFAPKFLNWCIQEFIHQFNHPPTECLISKTDADKHAKIDIPALEKYKITVLETVTPGSIQLRRHYADL